MNFLLSTIALLFGPLVYAVGYRNAVARHILDSFVFITIAWIIGVHIIPESLSAGGALALVFLALGIAFPILLERVFHVASKAAHIAIMIIAAIGLSMHAVIDGIALLPASGDRLAHAIIVHRIPVGMALWWTFRPALGTAMAIVAFVLIIVSTGIAYFLGAPVIEMAENRNLAMFQAFVSGSLIDLVVIGVFNKIKRPSLPTGPTSADSTDHQDRR